MSSGWLLPPKGAESLHILLAPNDLLLHETLPDEIDSYRVIRIAYREHIVRNDVGVGGLGAPLKFLNGKWEMNRIPITHSLWAETRERGKLKNKPQGSMQAGAR